MRSTNRRNILLISLLIFFATLLLSSSIAHAEEIPVLTWERGQVQNVVLGQGDTSGSWDLYLTANNGQSLKASKSFANEGNYYVYSLSIPTDFPISGYVIEAVNLSGEIKQVAGVQVIEKISTEITRTPFELFLVLIGISYFFYLMNFSKNRKISIYEFDSNAKQSNKFQNKILNKAQIQIQKSGRQSLLKILLSEEMKVDFKFASTINIIGLFGILTLSSMQFAHSNWTLASVGLIALCLVLGNLSITYGIAMMLVSILFLVLNIASTKTFAEILSILVISSIFTLPNIYNQFLFSILDVTDSTKLQARINPFLSAFIAAFSSYQLLMIFESLNPNQIFLGYSKEIIAICMFAIFAFKNLLIFRRSQIIETVNVVRSISPVNSILTSIFIASIVYIWTTNLILFVSSFIMSLLILSFSWLKFNLSNKLHVRSLEPEYALITISVVILSVYLSTNVLPMDVINRSHFALLLIFLLNLFLAIYLIFSETQTEVNEKS